MARRLPIAGSSKQAPVSPFDSATCRPEGVHDDGSGPRRRSRQASGANNTYSHPSSSRFRESDLVADRERQNQLSSRRRHAEKEGTNNALNPLRLYKVEKGCLHQQPSIQNGALKKAVQNGTLPILSIGKGEGEPLVVLVLVASKCQPFEDLRCVGWPPYPLLTRMTNHNSQ